MLFTNNKRLLRAYEMPTQTNTSMSPVMTFSSKFRNHMQSAPSLSGLVRAPSAPLNAALSPSGLVRDHSAGLIPAAKQLEHRDPMLKPMKWGEPTWFLFHSLAEKIKPQYFAGMRAELFQMVASICANLPCPVCATHAKQYLDGTNIAAIVSKDHLRMFFHRFHNEVNRRKGMPLFAFDDLTDKYSKANTVAIIHHFISHFEDRSPKSARMISDTLYRQRIVSVLKAWFSKNIQYFEL